jgi:hypothetical protein
MLIASDEAVKAKSQITKPCSDCPLSRGSLNGWLGGGTPEDWGHALHSESRMNCHVLEGAQCAGAAIYRSNICKRMIDKELLVLPSDHGAVFSNRVQFLDHHNSTPVKKASGR